MNKILVAMFLTFCVVSMGCGRVDYQRYTLEQKVDKSWYFKTYSFGMDGWEYCAMYTPHAIPGRVYYHTWREEISKEHNMKRYFDKVEVENKALEQKRNLVDLQDE